MIVKNNNLAAHYTYEHNDGDQIWDDETKFFTKEDGTYERHFKDGYSGDVQISSISLKELKKEINEVKNSPYQISNPNFKGGYILNKDFVEPLSDTKFKVGAIAYFYEHWSDAIEKCQVKEIKEIDGIKCAEVRSIGTVDIEGDIICNTYGTSTRRIEDLYPSCEAAYKAYYDKFDDTKSKYLEEIKDLKDLLRFPLEHCFNGEEYTEYEAIAAYKQRVKELVGIDLDNEIEKVVSVKEDISDNMAQFR